MTGIHLMQVLTPLHVGEGTRVGAVDLPIARERHTDWPFVPGSAVKGALRARTTMLGGGLEAVCAAFGSEPGETPLRRGRLEFGDATLLLLPVRSFHQTLVLLASPLSLGRFARAVGGAPSIPEPPSADRILVSQGFSAAIPGGPHGIAVLEDLCVVQDVHEGVTAWRTWLASHWVGIGDEAPLGHLVIVHDDLFAWASRGWIPTRTRNAIDPATGVVDEHKLFTVEYLPPETVLWTRIANRDANESVLPGDGDGWALGGHKSTGSGRVTLWGEAK